jgi:hypothetical protein
LLNVDKEAQVEAKKKKKVSAKSRGLKSATRSFKDIESTLKKVVQEDRVLKHLFNDEEHDQGFKSLKQMIKDDVWKELLQLIEIALINKTPGNISDTEKKVLVKRLASLLKPQGLDESQTTSQQLKVIDTYLADLSDKAAIQEVVDLVKPLFFRQIMTKLQETGSALG